MSEPVTIQTPARLHFGLLDLNGGLGRVDGGIGLALEKPRTVISVVRNAAVEVSCPMDREFEGRLGAAARSVCESYGFTGATVRVVAQAQPHSGLGSASQTLVGAGIAICALHGKKAIASEIAALVGRGGTSGIGVGAIESGGFLLDGGHRFRRGQGSKEGYSPSSASVGVPPPPVLARYNFPSWDVLIVIPSGEGASGERERDLFEDACPIAARDVEKMARILLVQMLPALVEADLPAFGAAMEAYQNYGFKRFELKTQGPLIAECIEFLRSNGGAGVGMSSWGPSLYAFGHDLSKLGTKAREWLAARGGGEVILTRANNTGYRLVPPGEGKASAASTCDTGNERGSPSPQGQATPS